MVVFDAATLILVLRPEVGVPLDSKGNPIAHVRERIAYLVQELEKSRAKIVIPTPSLSEALVRAGSAAPKIASALEKSAVFEVRSFDTLAAIEVAEMTRDAINAGDKRGGVAAPWTKVKYDRQIVAIAKVAGADTIYSDDDDIRTLAKHASIKVVGVAELPLPPDSAQPELPLQPTPERAPANDAIDADAAIDEATDVDDAQLRDGEEGERPSDPAAEVHGEGEATGAQSEPGGVRGELPVDSPAPAKTDRRATRAVKDEATPKGNGAPDHANPTAPRGSDVPPGFDDGPPPPYVPVSVAEKS